MARKKIYIPEEVKQAIKQHLSAKYPIALEGFMSGNEEEDTLTGDLGATLRVKDQKVQVRGEGNEFPGEWTWSIDYYKFRGRGPSATESKVGADGLFELALKRGSYVEKKSLLFQAKIEWKNDPNLIKEAIKLSNWREASFVLNFTPTKFEAIDLDTIISSRGKRNDKIVVKPLDEFIGSDFLDCKVGDVDLRYNAISRKLIWRAQSGEVVATRFSIPSRISIQISAPKVPNQRYPDIDKEIRIEEIHNYRMNADEEEMLSLIGSYTDRELKMARSEKAHIYHSDKHFFGDQLLDELMKKRMQEINLAYDILKKKKKE